jgi:hypothetical protein
MPIIKNIPAVEPRHTAGFNCFPMNKKRSKLTRKSIRKAAHCGRHLRYLEFRMPNAIRVFNEYSLLWVFVRRVFALIRETSLNLSKCMRTMLDDPGFQDCKLLLQFPGW